MAPRPRTIFPSRQMIQYEYIHTLGSERRSSVFSCNLDSEVSVFLGGKLWPQRASETKGKHLSCYFLFRMACLRLVVCTCFQGAAQMVLSLLMNECPLFSELVVYTARIRVALASSQAQFTYTCPSLFLKLSKFDLSKA